ncbi:hypothetical protein [Gilliamella sp. ESL0405]|uniref:hypothetical protein n=1 Tax=Gilliamella sp. ESL0405 TaxID=2704653 RepID=UPI001C6952F9|nr:hypothetical protein [Gilliamella sp. ESL0405]QYN47182.1 sel1 repeat family protein [Gilliamella sp. ESL0405]
MLKKLFLFILLGSLSTSVFSLNHYKMVFDDIKKKKEEKVLKELEEGNTTNLTYLTQLGMSYIELANTLHNKSCNKIYNTHDLVSTWKNQFVLTNDIYYGGYDEEDDRNNYWSYRCKNLEIDKINGFIKPKLVDKGLSLIRIAIMNGDLNAIKLVMTLEASRKNPIYYYFHDFIGYMEKENNQKVNGYVSFLIGQAHLTGESIDRSPSKALWNFSQAKDIGEPSLPYFIALAKIEDQIETLLNNEYLFNEKIYKNNNTEVDKSILKDMQDNAFRGDIPSLLYLSGYYLNEVKMNKALMYFKKACALSYSPACEIYKNNLKYSYHKELYPLLAKFDKDKPDPKTATKIAKWFEKRHKYLTAIYFYTYASDNDPKLFLHIADLYYKTRLTNNEKEKKTVENYTKYVNYVKDPKIMEKLYHMSRDNDKRIYWIKEPARYGAPFSQKELARMYMVGYLLPQDFHQAIYWYNRYCFDIEREYTSSTCSTLDELRKNPQLQHDLENNDMNAQSIVGWMFTQHLDLWEAGRDYLQKAADQGLIDAKIGLQLTSDKNPFIMY